MITSLDAFADGDRLHNYQIQERLGAGGMATVYLGKREGAAGFSVPVVIKVIHPHLSAEHEFVRMFINEARISAMINHPNVVHVEEFGEQDGRYYLVMEYVDGCSLATLLKANRNVGRTLAPEVACAIIARAADGLHAAHTTKDATGHELDVVHRDVSPSNILISRTGVVKVIDFGLAKAHGRINESKSNASLKGKIRYMSPEQAYGHRLDRRSDLYSLAIVLWELLVGRPLHDAANELAVLQQAREPNIPPPSSEAAVPEAIDGVIARATQRQPSDRYETAADFRRALYEAMPGAALVEAEQLGAFVTLAAGFAVKSPVGSGPSAVIEAGEPTVATRNLAPSNTPTARLGTADIRSSRLPLLAGALVLAIAGIATAVLIGRDSDAETAPAPADAAAAPTTAPATADAAPAADPPLDAGVEPEIADAATAPVAPRKKPPRKKPPRKKPPREKPPDGDIGIPTDFDAPGARKK